MRHRIELKDHGRVERAIRSLRLVFEIDLRERKRHILDAVTYRPMSGPHTPKGQLNLAVRDDTLASPANAFLALVRKDAGSVRTA